MASATSGTHFKSNGSSASTHDSSISQKDDHSIVLWDLNKQKIYSVIQLPHNGRPITHLAFMPNEPILISSSDSDNSIKMWFFEKGVT